MKAKSKGFVSNYQTLLSKIILSQPKERLLQIHAYYHPNFTAGVLLKDNVVTKAAPIVKYMIGWTHEKVLHYAKKRGWSIMEVGKGKKGSFSSVV